LPSAGQQHDVPRGVRRLAYVLPMLCPTLPGPSTAPHSPGNQRLVRVVRPPVSLLPSLGTSPDDWGRLPLAEALGGVQKTADHSRAGEAGSGGSSGATAWPRSRGDASPRAPVHDPMSQVRDTIDQVGQDVRCSWPLVAFEVPQDSSHIQLMLHPLCKSLSMP